MLIVLSFAGQDYSDARVCDFKEGKLLQKYIYKGWSLTRGSSQELVDASHRQDSYSSYALARYVFVYGKLAAMKRN